MKKILVTGATGFIGNYVVEALLKKGIAVIATSSQQSKAMLFPWYQKVTYLPFNLETFEDTTNYMAFFHHPDAMIHLAWEGLPNYKAPFHLEDNLPRHFSFLSNMVKNGLTDLTVTGTCLEYGMTEGELSEELPPQPGNAYAQAKCHLQQQLNRMASRHPVKLKWLRLFYMYGEGQNPKSLISQLDNALDRREAVFNMSGGEQVRDFLPVNKVAEYIISIALQQEVTGIINCCSGIPVTVHDFVLEYLKTKKKHIKLNLGYYPYTDYEPMKFWGNNEKLKSILKK